MTIAIPQTFTPTASPTFSRIALLAPIVNCPNVPYPPFVASIGNGWNCTKCGSDPIYYLRYKIGDTIPLQVALPDLKNTNPLTPTIGWLSSTTVGNAYYIKAELLDFDCTTVIYSFVDSFCSDFWVSFDENIGAIQTLFIDTNLLPIGQEIFRIRLTWYDNTHTAVDTVYTEPFMLESPCEDTILLRGDNSTRDCIGRIYYEPEDYFRQNGLPLSYRPTPFWAQIRLQGDIVEVGYTNEKQLNDNNVLISQKSSKDFEFRLYPIPPYAAEMLNAVLVSERVTVDGQEYTNFSDVSKRLEKGRAFAPIVTASQICNIQTKGCE